jgi:hypothetical protein
MPTAAQLPAETQEIESSSPPVGRAPAAGADPVPNPHTEITATVPSAKETRTRDRPATEITPHGFAIA